MPVQLPVTYKKSVNYISYTIIMVIYGAGAFILVYQEDQDPAMLVVMALYAFIGFLLIFAFRNYPRLYVSALGFRYIATPFSSSSFQVFWRQLESIEYVEERRGAWYESRHERVDALRFYASNQEEPQAIFNPGRFSRGDLYEFLTVVKYMAPQAGMDERTRELMR